jgi:hypothetical protein
MTWTARAEELAESLCELGEAAAGVTAATWRAGVDPAATDGLVGAAVAVGAAPSALFTAGEPMPGDREMLGCAEDLAASAAVLHDSAQRLHAQVEDALEAAARDLDRALKRQAGAKSKGEEHAAVAAAREARRFIADCECALDILTEAIRRLGYARDCLSRVPDDLETTYEIPYAYLRHGGLLPHHGDFLTGEPACA